MSGDTPRAVDHEGHEAHEDGADLAAAFGGEAICERRRPTRRIKDLSDVLSVAGAHRSQPGEAGLARSAGVSNRSSLVGFFFVFFVAFVVDALGKRLCR